MSKIAIFILGIICLFTTGCLALSGDYTPNMELATAGLKTKYAITFSVDYFPFPPEDDTIVVTPHANEKASDVKERSIKIIKQYLEESGAFSSVAYRDYSIKSKYHIHFYAYYCPPEDSGSAAIGILSLGLIPIYQDEYYDFSAFLFLNDKIVCAPSTSERMRIWYWLPYFPALVYPPGLVRKNIEKKCWHYLICELLQTNIDNAAKTASANTNSAKVTTKTEDH